MFMYLYQNYKKDFILKKELIGFGVGIGAVLFFIKNFFIKNSFYRKNFSTKQNELPKMKIFACLDKNDSIFFKKLIHCNITPLLTLTSAHEIKHISFESTCSKVG